MPNTNARKASRSTVLLKANRVLGTNGASQFVGQGGKQSFVLCYLEKKTENEHELREKQMQVIEKLEIGTHFWIHLAARSSSSQDPIPQESPDLSFNLPVFNSV
jgi:hypothetical protein